MRQPNRRFKRNNKTSFTKIAVPVAIIIGGIILASQFGSNPVNNSNPPNIDADSNNDSNEENSDNNGSDIIYTNKFDDTNYNVNIIQDLVNGSIIAQMPDYSDSESGNVGMNLDTVTRLGNLTSNQVLTVIGSTPNAMRCEGVFGIGLVEFGINIEKEEWTYIIWYDEYTDYEQDTTLVHWKELQTFSDASGREIWQNSGSFLDWINGRIIYWESAGAYNCTLY